MISEEKLARVPSDPERANNYLTLYELWKKARSTVDLVAADEKQFEDWDLRVQGLLDPAEREFYLTPYDGLDLKYLDYRAVSRMNHLTKILLNRQGINEHGPG